MVGSQVMFRNGDEGYVKSYGPLSTNFVIASHENGDVLLFKDGQYRMDGVEHPLDIVSSTKGK